MSSRWKHVWRIHHKRALKINGKKKIYLLNSLIQPHFDFACCAWYPNLLMSLKNKFQTAQDACIKFFLGMERRSHIGLNHFEKINLLPVKNRVYQCIAGMAYNFKNKLSSLYISDIYILNSSLIIKTRRSVDCFVEPIYMKEVSRKSILYLGFKIWNGLDKNIKTSTSTHSFNYALKKQFLKN